MTPKTKNPPKRVLCCDHPNTLSGAILAWSSSVTSELRILRG